MARQNQNNKKNKLSPKSLVFWGSILLVTIAFFVVIVIKWVDSSKVVTSYDRMEQLISEEIFQQYDRTVVGKYEYYVFVYGSSEEENYASDVNDLEEHICDYLTYVNRNDDAIKLYGFDIDNAANEHKIGSSSRLTEDNFAKWCVSRSDVPSLIKVTVNVTQNSSGTNSADVVIDYAFTNVQSIKTELDNIVNPKE